MRDSLRSVLIGACGLPAVLTTVLLTTAAPATASDAGPQRSATPNVTAEIGYARAQVHPGDQDTMTVSLINHGPQSLDDHTSVHVTVTMPQDTEVSPSVVETIPGNAPSGSSNAVPSTRSVPLTQVFVRSTPGFFDVVVPAGSFGDSTSFRTYAFTLRVSPSAPQGAQLIGGGVAVALENYVGLTVVKSIVAPPPVVVPVPKSPGKSHKSGGSGSTSGKSANPRSTAESSEWIQRGTPDAGIAGIVCFGGSVSIGSSGMPSGGLPSGSAGSGGTASGGAASGNGMSGGLGQCSCPVDHHMSAKGGAGGGSQCGCPVGQHMSGMSGGTGTGGSNSNSNGSGGSSGGGERCVAVGLAATGTASTWPLALGVFALAGGVLLLRVAHRRNGNWSRP